MGAMYRLNWTEERKLQWKKAAFEAAETTCSIAGTIVAVLILAAVCLSWIFVVFIKWFPYTLPILPIVAIIFGHQVYRNIQKQKSQ